MQRSCMAQVAVSDIVNLPILELLRLSVVPVLNRPVVTCNPAVNLRLLPAVRAGIDLPGQVSVVFAHRVGWAHGVVGQLVVFCDLPHQRGCGFPVRQFLPQECVEHGSGGIQGLQFILHVQRGEYIFTVSHREVAGIGIVRLAVLVGRHDIRILLLVVLGETVCGGFRRCRLQIVQVTVLLLVVAQPGPHVVQHILGKLLGFRMGKILLQPLRVQAGFVHTHQSDGGEVVIECTQVALGVGIQPAIQQLGDDRALRLQAPGRNIHQPIQPVVEVFLILRQISDPGQVDGHHPDGSGALSAAEETAALFPQFTQVQPQPAAHGAYIIGFHVAVDVVAEIGRAVFRGHLKQELVVFRFAPVEVPGNGVGGNRILEAPSDGVAFDHDVDEGFVHHVHFLLAVAVGEVQLLPADDGRQVRQVLRADPVQRNIGERCLRAPAGRRVHAVDEALDTLLDFLLAQVVNLDKGGQVGVEAGERLGAGPLILHDPQEVHHLIAQGRQMSGRGGGNLPGNAAQALLNQLLQAPACAVAGQHAQVMQMQGC